MSTKAELQAGTSLYQRMLAADYGDAERQKREAAELERDTLKVAVADLSDDLRGEGMVRRLLEASLAKANARIAELEAALRDLVDHVDDNECHHESVHRGGVIWTICDECGQKWADDEGGFQPYEEPPVLSRARTALIPVHQEAGK